jgi:hypothetical protein
MKARLRVIQAVEEARSAERYESYCVCALVMINQSVF